MVKGMLLESRQARREPPDDLNLDPPLGTRSRASWAQLAGILGGACDSKFRARIPWTSFQ